MQLKRIDLDLTVCKVPSVKEIDLDLGFYFIGRTEDEISLVCPNRQDAGTYDGAG
jgi:hypothetical protein